MVETVSFGRGSGECTVSAGVFSPEYIIHVLSCTYVFSAELHACG